MPNTYITDRTASDCELVHVLYNKIVSGTASTSEKNQWYSGLKGSLNKSDLSRLADIFINLKDRANNTQSFPTISYTYNPTTMKGWTESTKLTSTLLSNYIISNAQTLKTAILTPRVLPTSIINYEDLNGIELFLQETEVLINNAPNIVDPPTNLTPTAQYNTQEHTNGFTYDATKISMTGQDRGTQAGTYVAVYTPIGNWVWKGAQTQTPISVTLTISSAIAVCDKPTNPSAATYTGNVITNGFNRPAHITLISGSENGTNVGTYTASYKPEAGYVWNDYTDDEVTITLTINTRILTIPSIASASYNYTGNVITPVVSGYDSTYSTQSGTASATNGGNYQLTWSLNSPANTKWSDNSTGAKSVSWLIQYTWTKWNASVYYIDNRVQVAGPSSMAYMVETYKTLSGTRWGKVNQSSYSFDRTTGKYSMGGEWKIFYENSSSPDHGELTAIASVAGCYGSDLLTSKTNSFDEIFECVNGNDTWYHYCFRGEEIEFWPLASGEVGYVRRASAAYEKGSTQYNSVASTDINAYPENGTPDNTYWYVKTW